MRKYQWYLFEIVLYRIAVISSVLFILCSEDVVAAVNDAIDRREEGVVIKDPTSCYKPSKRKGIEEVSECSEVLYSMTQA